MIDVPGHARLHGRRSEQSALAALSSRRGGPPAVLVLSGPAGVGKSALWRVGVELLGASGRVVLRAQPGAREARLPFAGLADLLDPLGGGWPAATPGHERAVLDAALLRRPPRTPATQLGVARAVLNVLRAIAADAPVAIAIDDVQWLDEPSAHVIEYVLRRGAVDAGLLAVRAERPDPLPLALEGLTEPGLERIDLGPLSEAVLGRIVSDRVGRAPSPAVLRGLHRASGGNPFFATEIVRAALARGDAIDGPAALPVPESLVRLPARRLAALTGGASEAVLLCALAAQPTWDLVERAGGTPSAIREALAAGVLVREGERLRVGHPLLAAAAHDRASPAERRAAHRALAAATGGHDRVVHLAEGTEGPEEAVAQEVAAVAAAARRIAAHDRAAELGEHAVRLTRAGSPRLALRTAEAAQHLIAAGRLRRARQVLTGLAADTPPGTGLAEVLLAEAIACYRADNLPDALALAGSAASHAAGDPALGARIAHLRAYLTAGNAPAEESLRSADDALAAAERTGDPGAVALGLTRVAVAGFVTGQGYERELFERALAAEDGLGDLLPEWLPSMWYACNAGFADDIETARRIFASRLRPRIERDGELALPLLAFQCHFECRAGDWVAADALAEEGVEMGLLDHFPLRRAMALGSRALIDVHLGRVEHARAAAGEGLRLAGLYGAGPPMLMNLWALGFLELALNDPAAAHERLGPLAQMIVAAGALEPGIFRFLPEEIEALIALGRLDDARPLLDHLERAARAVDRHSMIAAACRCRALMFAQEGSMEEARAAIADALLHHGRLRPDQPFERARTLLAAGRVERRAGARGRARGHLSDALALFEGLGAPLFAAQARAELGHIPGRRSVADGGLTDAERRIAELAARGLTNRQIAETLFVSVRTVEANLGRAYAKQGVRSRIELVLSMRDGDLPTPDDPGPPSQPQARLP